MRQHSGKKRLGAVLLSLALCLSLLPGTALAAENVGYIYYEWNETTQTLSGPKSGNADSATEVTASDTTWGASGSTSWYVAQGEVEIGSRVTVNGDVRLILEDGCNLTVNRGIRVELGDSLTIYGQSQGTRSLMATGWGSHGIGGAPSGAVGTITIYGGNVTAKGDVSNAGIGIGSARQGPGGTLTIYGGNVTAEGGNNGAGIGGGPRATDPIVGTTSGGDGGTVIIYGGTVTATGNNGGAGIGGGPGVRDIVAGTTTSGGDGGTVTIYGGTVTATGDNGGAGIGVGVGGDPGTAGSFSTGENGHAVIFASGGNRDISAPNGNGSWSGVIFEGDGGQVYGTSITPTEDFKIEAGKTLTIGAGQTLTIPAGVTLTNEGTINNSGTIVVFGTLDGEVTGTGEVNHKVTGVSLSPETLALDVGDSATLTATVTPENAEGKTVTWSSDHSEIVAVTPDTADSKKATITAKGTGTATITATAADGSGKTAACTVTVERPYVPPANPNYRIDLTTTEGGTVDKDPSAAKAGETVTLTPAPDAGYEVGEIIVTDRFGDAVEVTENADGTYTFTMPNGQVRVSVTFVEVQPEPLPFTDVKESDWFHDAVRYVYDNGLMDGVGDGQFAPNATTTRAQLVTILYRLAGEPDVSGDVGFTDVETGLWY
ncbi:MAG TPA: Ig-like domain-containing protein, partial [Candidatus Evtepia faecavium]|nr:Ig-like domain-containing protein [Candidatus Evtepia faecavium]